MPCVRERRKEVAVAGGANESAFFAASTPSEFRAVRVPMQQPTPRLSATLALEEYRSRLGAVLNLLEDAAHGRLEFPTESEELVKTLDGLVDYLLAGEASVMSTREALAQHNKQYEELQALQAQADEAYADVVVAALDAEAALSRLAERHCEAETRAAVIRAVADGESYWEEVGLLVVLCGSLLLLPLNA